MIRNAMPMQKSNNVRGAFITLEGGDGSGKSTQLKLLTEYLQSNGSDCVFTREPGGTAISEKIREIILDGNNAEEADETEALLYAAARAQLVKELIIPSIEQGKIVVCDRYIDSSVAYQGYARGLGKNFIDEINSFPLKHCMPDVTLFFDIKPERAFARKGGADKNDRIEQSGAKFHEKVYEGYKKQASVFPERIAEINAEQSVEEVFADVLKVLKERNIIK